MKKGLFSLLLVVLFAAAALAQTSRGVVSGTITDSSGAVIPGAEVVLTNVGTSVPRTSATNSEGFYRFDAVNLGQYKISINATGFGATIKTGITVNANQTSAVDAQLQPGGQEVIVEVTSDGSVQLQTESSVRGGNISAIQITELPLAGNPVALALTLPGVSSNRGGFGVGTFSVNGARGRSNNFLIDGTENNDISVAGQGFQITNQDAVQEVSVQTGNYDSEFGRAGGAVVNVITKSGTKDFHGTLAFEYDSSADDAITAAESRNPAIIARGRPLSSTSFVPSATFGGPLFMPNFGEGGPVFDTSRDKNFFFVAYEDNRFRQPGGSTTLIVPTGAGRAVLQQFAANPNVAAYLAATADSVAEVANRPSISLSNSNLPAAQQTRGIVQTGTFFRTFSNTTERKQFQLRTDHALSEKDQLSFRYLSDNLVSPLSTVNFPGFDSDQMNNYYNFLIAETHVFSSSMTNELRVAYNRIDLGFPLSDPSISGSVPTLAIAGLTSRGAPTNIPQGRIANNYQVQDTLTKIIGDHTLRGGIDYLRQISTQVAPADIRGTLTYGAGGGFTALGNFVDNFGGSGNASRVFGSTVYNPSLHRIATFVQDRWKFSQDLTLTMGVRYEYFGTAFNSLRTPAYTGLFNVDPITRTGPFSAPNQVARDTNNYAPSVGLAYSPSFSSGILGFIFGEKQAVIRTGYNLGYDSFFNNIASNAAASSPNTIATTNTSTLTAANPRGLANFSDQFPTTAANVLATSGQTLIDPNLVNPYYQRWSLGFQRQLPLKLIIDVSYVGSKGTKLYINEDANPTVRPELRVTPLNPNTGLPVTGSLTNRLDNIQGGRTVRTNGGSSTYHSGQLEVRRRFANNFQVTGAYTYSSSISNADEVFTSGFGSGGTSFFALPAVFGGDQFERARSLTDRPHRFTATFVAQSPFFKDQKGILGKILGGFQLSGINTLESGVPFTIFNGFDSDGVAGANRPTHNPNGQRGVRAIPLVDANNNITGYYNPELVVGSVTSTSAAAAIDPNTAEFIVNPTYVAGLSGSVVRFGNLGRNTERTLGINNWDMTVLKRTRITETIGVEFRTEFFNAFNRPQYSSGDNVANAITNGQFLQPINRTTSGGGRSIRYQVKLIF